MHKGYSTYVAPKTIVHPDVIAGETIIENLDVSSLPLNKEGHAWKIK